MDFINKNIFVIIKTLSVGHPVTAIVLVSIFFGEPGVLFLSFLAAQHFFSVTLVVAIAYSGALVCELFWFLIGRSKLFYVVEKWIVRTGIADTFTRFTKRMNPQYPFKTLLLARFISGLTIPIIVYLSRKGTSLKTFFLACLAVNIIWTPVIVLMGWLAGRGFTLLLNTLENIEFVVSIFVVIGIIALILEKRLKTRLLRKKI